LLLKYEGDLTRATELELEHADRGMDPQVARRIAEAEYKRKERNAQNETKKTDNPKVPVGDSSFPDRLF